MSAEKNVYNYFIFDRRVQFPAAPVISISRTTSVDENADHDIVTGLSSRKITLRFTVCLSLNGHQVESSCRVIRVLQVGNHENKDPAFTLIGKKLSALVEKFREKLNFERLSQEILDQIQTGTLTKELLNGLVPQVDEVPARKRAK